MSKSRAQAVWEQLKAKEASKVATVGSIYQSQREASSTPVSSQPPTGQPSSNSNSYSSSAPASNSSGSNNASLNDDPAIGCDDLTEVQRLLARDMNMLSDDSVAVLAKRPSLTRILSVVSSSSNPSVLKWDSMAFASMIMERLLRGLLLTMKDSSEKNRSLSISILAQCLSAFERAPELVPRFCVHVIPALADRLADPVKEESEEVRLSLMDMLLAILPMIPPGSTYIQTLLSDISSICKSAISMPHSDMRLRACSVVSMLDHASLTMIASSLLPAYASALSDHHAKVRIAAVQATSHIVLYGLPRDLEAYDNHLKTAYRLLLLDTHEKVRSAVFTAATSIAQSCYDLEAAMLPLVLYDERHLEATRIMGKQWAKYHESELDEIRRYNASETEGEGEGRLPLEARMWVRNNVRRSIKGLIGDLEDTFSREKRVHAAVTLGHIVEYMEGHVVEWVEAIVGALMRSQALEEELRQSLCERIGRYVPVPTWAVFVAPRVAMHVTSSHLSSVFAMATWLLGGASASSSDANDFSLLQDAIESPDVRRVHDPQVLLRLKELLVRMAQVCPSTCGRMVRTWTFVVGHFGYQPPFVESGFFVDHAAEIFSQSPDDVPLMQIALNHLSADAVAPLWGVIVDNCLKPLLLSSGSSGEGDVLMQAKILSMLRRVVREAHDSRGMDVVVSCFVPFVPWRPRATLVRKEAVAGLADCMRGYSEPQGWEAVFPLLEALMEDDEPTIRTAAVQLVHDRCVHGGQLAYEQHRTVYEALLKRMDDPHDSIRIDTCGAMKAWVERWDADADKSVAWMEYTIDTLLVHLDDANGEVQRAVLTVLQRIQKVEGEVGQLVTKKATDVRNRMRDKHYVDKLLQNP
jgi:hypothetical protein